MIDADTRHSFYIGGRWVRSSRPDTIPVIAPATEESIAEIAMGTAADVDRAAAAARAAFPAYASLSVEARVAFLDRIHALLLERAELFARTISLEMGAAISHARSAHVPFAVDQRETAKPLATSNRPSSVGSRRRRYLEISRPSLLMCGIAPAIRSAR